MSPNLSPQQTEFVLHVGPFSKLQKSLKSLEAWWAQSGNLRSLKTRGEGEADHAAERLRQSTFRMKRGSVKRNLGEVS